MTDTRTETHTDSITEEVLGAMPMANSVREALHSAAGIEAHISAMQRTLAARAALVTLQAISARGEDGKALHTNDQSRKAAADLAVNTDPECLELAGHIDSLLQQRRYADANADALKIAARYLCARLTANTER